MKYKAPAVHQAIEIIELLIRTGSLTLGQIAEQTGFSKATILRLLETMEAHYWIGKVSGGKAYESLIFIRPKNVFPDVSEQLIQNIIDELCAKTNRTIEWYRPDEKYAEIVLRCEPRNRAVNISAQLGYHRMYARELEAVTRIAMASGMIDCRKHEPDIGYSTYKNGKCVHIALPEALEMVKQVGNDLLTWDLEWNSHGIRRHAVGIRDKTGKLKGIMALATSFTPDADAKIEELNQQLKNAANKLEKLFKQSTQ